ncbi:MAG: hemerythrin domain-containing protein [Vulcanimicrobiota bacterium]
MQCDHWDVQHTFPAATELSKRLGELGHNQAILVQAKTSFPSDWNQAYFHLLIDGPSRFARVYFTAPAPPPALDDLRQEHQAWLQTFQRLRAQALAGDQWRADAEHLEKRIIERLSWEENEIYPALEEFLRATRPTREMRYEHDGIRRFLPELRQALEQTESNRAWERFSLDLIHLLEHHIEHEERGLYPVYERLLKEGKGPGRVQ